MKQKFYRLYIDESGDHYYSNSDLIEKRFLCLLGVYFDLEYYEKEFQPNFEQFKIKQNAELNKIYTQNIKLFALTGDDDTEEKLECVSYDNFMKLLPLMRAQGSIFPGPFPGWLLERSDEESSEKN